MFSRRDHGESGRNPRFGRRRKVLVGVMGAGVVAASVAFSTSGGGGLLKASPAAASGQDYVQYVQTTGNNGTYVQYFSASANKVTAKESVTSGGGCANPTLGGTQLLNFQGFFFANNNTYGNTPSSVPVTLDKQRTGVCALGNPWSIDNVSQPSSGNSSWGSEALDFVNGGGAPVAGRVFSEAKINLQRFDKLAGDITVNLVEKLKMSGVETAVANQCYDLNASTASTPRLVDTNAPDGTVGSCATSGSPLASGFDDIEVQVLTQNGSVSVVGPSSTFLLATQICGSGPNGTTFPATTSNGTSIVFSVTLGNGICKSYTDFESGQQQDGTQFATFDAFSATPVHFTIETDWAPQTECSPDGSALADGTTTECAPTMVTIDGFNFKDQTYCAAATAGDPVCTTKKVYNYLTAPDGTTTLTEIQETWDALIDVGFHN